MIEMAMRNENPLDFAVMVFFEVIIKKSDVFVSGIDH